MGNDEHGPAYPEPKTMSEYKGAEPPLWLRLIMVVFVVGLMLWMFTKPAPAMDHGFSPTDPTVHWFERLQRPDMPGSCCGKGDAYPVEDYRPVNDGSGDYIAKIGDGSAKLYPDGTTRQAIPDGTEIRVPEALINKLDDDLDNPTDVSWIFMTVHGGEVGTVYCLIRHLQGG